MNIGQLFLELLADSSRLTASVVAAAQAAGSKGSEALGQRLTKGLTTAGQSLTRTGSSLTQGLTLPIVAAGVAVTKFALDFDTSMRQVVGLAKVPQSEIAGIKKEILSLSTETGRAPNELAQAFYFVASAGFKADEAFKVLQVSAKAAAAGMGETQDIAKTLGGVINAYGHDNLTAAHAVDVLTAAVQDGSAEASDFAGAIGQVVPNAAAMGVSFDQVAAALASMTNVGVDANTAATNLSQIFTAMLKPTSQANDALASVGLSAAGLRQELKDKGLLATLRTLQGAFEGNDTAIAAVFGNIRALRGVNALLAQDEAQLNGVFKDTATALGNLNDAYNASDGPQRSFNKALASLQAAAIDLGGVVLPAAAAAMTNLGDTVRGVVGVFTSLPVPIQEGVIQILALTATIGPVLFAVGKLSLAFAGLGKVVLFLTGSGAGSLGALVMQLPLIGPAAAKALGPTALLVAALLALREAAGFAASQSDLGRSLQDSADFASAAGVTIGELNDKIYALAHDTGQNATTIADAIRTELGKGSTLDEAIQHVRSQFEHLLDPLPPGAGYAFAHGYGPAVGAGLAAGADAVKAGATTMMSGLDKAVLDAQTAAGDTARHTPYEIAKSFKEGEDAVYQAALALGEQQTQAQDITNTIIQKQNELASADLAKQLKDKDPATRAAAQSHVNQLKHEIFALQAELDPKAALASKTLADALQDEDPRTRRWAQALADALQTEITAQMPETQQAADDQGALLPEALHAGILAAQTAAFQQATAVTTALQTAHRGAVNAGFKAGEGFGDGVNDPANGTHAKNAGLQIGNDVNDGFEGNPWYKWGSATAEAWIQGLIDSMNAAHKKRLNDALRGFTSDLQGGSPPKTGPLHLIDRWGANVGDAWISPFVAAIGGAGRRLQTRAWPRWAGCSTPGSEPGVGRIDRLWAAGHRPKRRQYVPDDPQWGAAARQRKRDRAAIQSLAGYGTDRMSRITYASTELQPTSGKFYFEIVAGWDDEVEVRGADTVVPSAAGRVSRTRVKDRRLIELRGWVTGQGATDDAARQDYASTMATLHSIFSPTASPAALVVHTPVLGVPTGKKRSLNARYLNALSSETFGAGLFRSMSVQLECVDYPAA